MAPSKKATFLNLSLFRTPSFSRSRKWCSSGGNNADFEISRFRDVQKRSFSKQCFFGKSQSRVPGNSGPEPRPAGRFPGKLMRRSRPPDFIAGCCGRFRRRAPGGLRERSRLDGGRAGIFALILIQKGGPFFSKFFSKKVLLPQVFDQFRALNPRFL